MHCCGTGKQKQAMDGFLGGGAGVDNVSLIDRAPHPNAAKLYINWVLTKEAHEGSYHDLLGSNCSIRADMQEWCKKNIRDLQPLEEGKAYVMNKRQSIQEITLRRANAIAQEVFGR
jgi:hypothetical protein